MKSAAGVLSVAGDPGFVVCPHELPISKFQESR